MSKKRIPIFEWDDATGAALCVLTDGEHTFVGTAKCAEEDMDMKGQKTGCTIALHRAKIAYYKHLRDNEAAPALKALNQLYYSMNTSKKFNPNSYENIMLQRQIHQKQFDLDTIKTLLVTEKQELYRYIQDKENTFKHIRENRAKKAQGQN